MLVCSEGTNIICPGTVDFMLSPPHPHAFFSTKKRGGGADLQRHFDFQPSSAKKGGGT